MGVSPTYFRMYIYMNAKEIMIMLLTQFNVFFNMALYVFSSFYLTRVGMELIEGQWVNQFNLLLLAVSVVGAYYGRNRTGLLKLGLVMGIISKFFMLGYV